jgi:hypothetical protein
MNLSGPALVAGTGLFCSGLAAGKLALRFPAWLWTDLPFSLLLPIHVTTQA